MKLRKAKTHRPVNHKDAYKQCNLRHMKFSTTGDLKPADEFIGQTRAFRAVKTGLSINSSGYNIYVAGESGLGKKTFLDLILRKEAKAGKVPDDLCYVFNFDNPKEPKIVMMPPGRGKQLRDDMENLVSVFQLDIPKIFESREFEEKKQSIADKNSERKDKLFERLRKSAKSKSIHVQITPTGIVVLPIDNKRPVSPQEFEKLDDDKKALLEQNKAVVDKAIRETMGFVSKIDREHMDELKTLERNTANFLLVGHMETLKQKYVGNKSVIKYLSQVQEDIGNNIEKFLSKPKSMTATLPPSMTAHVTEEKNPLTEYKVNILTDNSQTKGAPVVFEPEPTYHNLFGFLEKEWKIGMMVTDFTHIRGGSICRANGGFLIIRAEDLLTYPFVWHALKNVLETGELRIDDISGYFGIPNVSSLRPEPVKTDLKVIVTGPSHLYHLLFEYDPDFRRLFKIKADFQDSIKHTEKNISDYANVLKRICEDEAIKNLSKDAVEAVLEHASRLSGDREKLSVVFGDMSKILVEADYWAREADSKDIRRRHILKAVKEKDYRSNMAEERINEMIERGSIIIDTDREVVGQVNGLSVYSIGDYSFGKPSRITCETFLGSEGVINIERRAHMSGNLHNKGVLILSGYIGGTYSRRTPLNLSASIGFEQSYNMIDGDSASAAELIALISSIADVPLKQGIAITGSVNQKGQIQPIGGVNEKIEGFFKVCSIKGIDGRQGVIIPSLNKKNLMLNGDVVDAIKNKRFSIYAIDTVNQAIEILTGFRAGERLKSGKFPSGTVNSLVEESLENFALEYRRFGKEDDEDRKDGRED